VRNATVIGYIRHSKAEQAQRMSPALQRREVERYATAHGLEVARWFKDSASGSAPITKRPGLQDALAQLRPGSTLIVYRLDRLSRNLETHLRLFRQVEKIGARILSATGEGTDGNGNDDPDARFLRDLSGLLAQHETRRQGKRIRDAIAAKKAEGRRWTGNAPYGYRWTADGRLATHTAEQRTVRLVIELREQGTTYRGIVDELKRRRRVNRAGRPFQLAQVQRMLRRAE